MHFNYRNYLSGHMFYLLLAIPITRCTLFLNSIMNQTTYGMMHGDKIYFMRNKL